MRSEGPGRLLIIEGVPGAGKTTTIEGICKVRKSIHVSSELDHKRGCGSHGLSVIDWYLKEEKERQSTIKNCLHSGIDVIQDRSVISTLAYAYALSMSGNDTTPFNYCKDRLRRLFGGSLSTPRAVVILMTTIPISLFRRRSYINPEYAEWFNQRFLSHYWRFYRLWVPAVFPGSHVVDTSVLTPNQVISVVMRSLQ